MNVIIIGAGASGLACAIKIKQLNKTANVTILERLSEPGKKILATGNGRCNITNTNAVNCAQTVNFFKSIGLILRTEEDRYYPYSLKAETVLETLLETCRKLNIEIITECEVTAVSPNLTISTSKGTYKADKLAVCTGGKAQPNLGSNGSGYRLLKKLGHSITPLCPALVQLESSSKYPRIIKGTRTRCTVQVELDGKITSKETGEVLFTNYGFSGIAVMNLSHIIARNFTQESPKKCLLTIDLVPEMTTEELKAHQEEFGSLKGIVGTVIDSIITKQAKGDKSAVPVIAKKWRHIITGTKGYDFAQITYGGIPIEEVDKNYQSKIVPNLFICGELLDEQFPCGGFNLDFAWHSGIKSAKEIAKE